MTRIVGFSPEAESDFLQLYDYIVEQSGGERALAYTQRVRAYCIGFAEFAERGTRRDDLWPGLRMVGFERRVSVVFQVTTDTVVIERVLYGGRDINAAFNDWE